MTYTKAQLDEIDRLVAEKVMGWLSTCGSDEWPLWHPTRFRGQAMLVFERCEGMELSHTRDGYLASNDAECVVTPEDRWYLVSAKTPMLAICLGALKGAGVKVPE